METAEDRALDYARQLVQLRSALAAAYPLLPGDPTCGCDGCTVKRTVAKALGFDGSDG